MKKNNLNICAFVFLIFLFFGASCGYHIIGSRSLPFQTITIKPVQNKTYEPGLEELLKRNLKEGEGCLYVIPEQSRFAG